MQRSMTVVTMVLLICGSNTAQTNQTTFTIKVTEVNDAPVATNVDLGSIAEDGQIVIVEGDLIAASSDLENHNLTVTGVTLTQGQGQLTL